jgi:DNA-directed RNA polymerase specialized sigma24 family protein
MSVTLQEVSPSDPPDHDHVRALISAALADLPRQDCNALLAFLDFFRDLPREQRALFVKSVKPDITDEEVARIAGVSRRTLYRWQRYQGVKPRLADLRAAKGRRWNTPDDDDA